MPDNKQDDTQKKKQDDTQKEGEGDKTLDQFPGQEGVPETEKERKKDLQDTFSKIQDMQKSVDNEVKMTEKELKQAKRDLFMNFFELVEKFGVNPTEPASVGKFLEQMESKDPELFDLFVAVFDSISSMPPGGDAVNPSSDLKERMSQKVPEGKAGQGEPQSGAPGTPPKAPGSPGGNVPGSPNVPGGAGNLNLGNIPKAPGGSGDEKPTPPRKTPADGQDINLPDLSI